MFWSEGSGSEVMDVIPTQSNPTHPSIKTLKFQAQFLPFYQEKKTSLMRVRIWITWTMIEYLLLSHVNYTTYFISMVRSHQIICSRPSDRTG